MRHNFKERKENRLANATHLAAKNELESEQLFNKSQEMASIIPMGQPIIVGHHSEYADRRYRNKIHNTMSKSIAASDKAAYYQQKARAIENNDAIFSDDPEALIKLETKLKTLKDNQEFMKAANRCLRKNDREAFLRLEFAGPKIWDELNEPKFGGKGFAHFSLSNNSANIRRIEKRIEVLKAQSANTAIDIVVNGIRIFENGAANRIQLFFDGKPKAEIITLLKSKGFRWCRTEGAWQRHISNTARYLAKQIAEAV